MKAAGNRAVIKKDFKWVILTGVGSVRKARHEERKQISQAVLSGVSKHYVGSFPTVAKLFVGEYDDPRI